MAPALLSALGKAEICLAAPQLTVMAGGGERMNLVAASSITHQAFNYSYLPRS
jgi:hypothetical protein